MAGTAKIPLILITTSHGFVCHIDFTADSILDIHTTTKKLFGIPVTQDFESGFYLQYLNNKKWIDLTAFEQLQEKGKIRLLDKSTEKALHLAGDTKSPVDWIGIHISSATVEGKIKENTKFYLIMSIGSKKDTPRFRTLSRSAPAWFENFVIALPSDSIKDGKIAETLTIKCYSETKPSGSDDLGKKRGAIEFSLHTLKKGEPHQLDSVTKHFSLNAEVRWFSETRGFQAIARREFNGMKGPLCSGARFYVPPPTNAFGKVKRRTEQLWFRDLSVMPGGIADLKKGDVLLQKFYGKKQGVTLAQDDFVGSHGTKWTCHAAIVCEDRGLKIAEASEARDSVSISPTFPTGNFLVFRPSDQDYANAAADWAIEIATKHNIKYSHAGLSSSVISIVYDEAAKVRHKFLAEMKNLPKAMMAAQFVVAAFQCKIEMAYIELNSLFVSPMKLEEYMNKNYSSWTFQGKLEEKTIAVFNAVNAPVLEDMGSEAAESAESTEGLDSTSSSAQSKKESPQLKTSSSSPKSKSSKGVSKKKIKTPRNEEKADPKKPEKENGVEEFDPTKYVIFI